MPELHDIEYTAVLDNHALAWPGLCCWWCTKPFAHDATPVPMAIDYDARTDRFELRGFFCELPCVKAFAISRQVSFSYSLMHAQRAAGRRRRRRPPVVAAHNYLSHPRFGPGVFKSGTVAVRRRTREVEPYVSSSGSRRYKRDTTDYKRDTTGYKRDTTGETPGVPAAAGSLRRSSSRYGGAGTLVPWLEADAESR